MSGRLFLGEGNGNGLQKILVAVSVVRETRKASNVAVGPFEVLLDHAN